MGTNTLAELRPLAERLARDGAASPGGPATAVDIRLLGPLEVAFGGARVGLVGAKQRSIVGLLALRAGEVVARAELVDALWGDDPPLTAVKTLHSHIAHVRRALAESGIAGVLATRDPGYVLAVSRRQVDAHRFDGHVKAARAAAARLDHAGAALELRAALAAWRGPALADCQAGEWGQAEATRLEEARGAATEDLLDAELGLGRHAAAVPELEYLVTRYPFRERLWSMLMRALSGGGRQVEALRAYQRAQLALAELGLEPGPELRRVEQSVLRGDTPPAAAPPASAPATTAAVVGDDRPAGCHRIPVPLTSLVGRAPEMAELTGLVLAERLVTITGAGGCGKTRLAVAVADRAAHHWRDGVAFVDLAAVSDPSVVAPAVAEAVGARGEGWPDVHTLADALGDRCVLVVLDNCEHLLGACAGLAAVLLRRCSGVHVLATSRQSLGVAGERTLPVSPLAVPDPSRARTLEDVASVDSAKLFLERAAACAGIPVDDGDAEAVATICARLDGLPLAIELVAARTPFLTVAQIAAKLDDRFELVAGGRPPARPRHRGLRAAVDWSYDLLDDAEQAMLRHLSVFAGSFSLDAAQAVADGSAGSTLDLLGSLVSKSLVQVERRRGRAQYRLLETIRQYAQEKLGQREHETEQAVRRHVRFFLELAEQLTPRLRGLDLEASLDDLDADLDNLRAALARLAAAGDGEQELHLAGALARYCYLRGRYREGRRWLETARSHAPRPRSDVLARALHGEGMLALYECDYEQADALCRQSMALYRRLGDRLGVARCETTLGAVARERGSHTASFALHHHALSLFRDAGDQWGVAHSLQLSGLTCWLHGLLDEAASCSAESLALFRRLGDKERTGWALLNLGAVAHYREDGGRARALLDEALALFRDVDFKEGVAWALNLLALGDQRQAEHDAARSLLAQSLRLHWELQDRWRTASVLEAMAHSAFATGAAGSAAELLGTAAALREAIDAPVPPCERADLNGIAAALRRVLGVEGLARAMADGRLRSVDQLLSAAEDGPDAGAPARSLVAG